MEWAGKPGQGFVGARAQGAGTRLPGSLFEGIRVEAIIVSGPACERRRALRADRERVGVRAAQNAGESQWRHSRRRELS